MKGQTFAGGAQAQHYWIRNPLSCRASYHCYPDSLEAGAHDDLICSCLNDVVKAPGP